MVVHTAPKTHPGGVHGALFKFWYQSDGTPSPVNNPPTNNPPKFIIRNSKILKIFNNDYSIGLTKRIYP